MPALLRQRTLILSNIGNPHYLPGWMVYPLFICQTTTTTWNQQHMFFGTPADLHAWLLTPPEPSWKKPQQQRQACLSTTACWRSWHHTQEWGHHVREPSFPYSVESWLLTVSKMLTLLINHIIFQLRATLICKCKLKINQNRKNYNSAVKSDDMSPGKQRDTLKNVW